MENVYACMLETSGYRIRVTVSCVHPSEVEPLARKLAVRRLQSLYAISRSEQEMNVVSIREMRCPT